MKITFTLQQKVLLWLACSAIFFEAFDIAIVNLALPLLAKNLHVSLAATQWVQTIYLLSYSGCLLLGGRLCDHFGSKRIFLAGMSIFGVASLLAALSSQLYELIPARAGQGIGASLAMPAAISLLARYFKDEEQNRIAFGIFGAFAAIGFAGGLSLGGLVASAFNWRWIFGINPPIIGLVLVTATLFIPNEKGGKRSSLPVGTSCWLTATLLLFSYTIHEVGDLGWKTLPFLAVAIGSGFLLMRQDQRQQLPFFEQGIYRSPEAMRGLTAITLLGFSFLPFIAISTLALYSVMGWGVQATGLLLFPYSIGSALVSRLLLPVLFKKIGVAATGLLSMCCLFLAAISLMLSIYTHRLPFYLVALLLSNSLAISIAFPSLTILSLTGVPPGKQGIAAGIQSCINVIGSGIGLSMVGLCLRSGATGESLLYACLIVIAGSGLAIQQLLTLIRKRSEEQSQNALLQNQSRE